MDGLSRVLTRIYEIQNRVSTISRQYSPRSFASRFSKSLEKNVSRGKEDPSRERVSRRGYTYLNRWSISKDPSKAIAEVPFAFRKKVLESAKKYNLPVELIVAVMKAESSFDPYAISPKGAVGLMQLMPQTAEMLGVEPLDPYQNIEGGVKYLRYLIDRYNGDLPLALAAYNAGPENVKDRIPGIEETQDYVLKVMEYFNEYLNSGE